MTRSPSTPACLKDRAAVLATAVLQIVRHARPGELRSHLEAYLRDEIADIEQQIAGSLR